MKLTKSDFEIGTLEDELRVDGLCRELLMMFYHERIASGMSEHDATLLASSADHYLRDYLIGVRQLNLLDSAPDVVRKFAGNWYIVNTLEPVIDEIKTHLAGILAFYRYLASIEAISPEICVAIQKDSSDLTYYQSRIDSFWAITADGYNEWERECSLK
jgi:hypothetical protein